MVSVQMPIPVRQVQLVRADGTPLVIPEGATADLTFDRVIHPRDTWSDDPYQPECIRIDHRFRDALGEQFIFTSYVRANSLWDQLYDSEAYADWNHLLERGCSFGRGVALQETVLIETIRGANDARLFRAFRIFHPEVVGHPDVVPVFAKHLTWTARVTLVTGEASWSTGVMRHIFVASFLRYGYLPSIRDVSPDDEPQDWKVIGMTEPFHVIFHHPIWSYGVEPDNDIWWQKAGPRPTITCATANA